MQPIAKSIHQAQHNPRREADRLPLIQQPPPPQSASSNASGQAPMCSTCGGTGYYRLDVEFGHPQFGRVIRCECKAREDVERLNRLSGLTATERRIKLEDIDTDGLVATAAMVIACQRFINNPRGIVTIYGGPGNGKTMALQACINAMLDKGVEAVYITAFDLLSYIREAFTQDRATRLLNVNDENAYMRLRRFERIPVLAIDELDKVKVTDWVLEQLTDLIDRRYRKAEDGQGGTLIAMNDDVDSQPSWIASRLKRYTVIHNEDGDMRPSLSQYEMNL
ncbi:MAG: ATP-binding protein [Chloroflexi bacterium]|nr:ATP-binding protein [Chloroflexota bacterium]